ncbi:MAG: hypothetical protein JXA67_04945 [Micromonosporaceae bacterium]|nr:hypothetical protein [Micromonosporaceae bacterium]
MAKRDGVMRRFRRWLAGPPAALPSARPDVDYEPADEGEPLVVAARGDVFDLQLIPHFRWSSGQMSYEALVRRSSHYTDSARSKLIHRIWAVAREFRPAETTEAERRINEEISKGWCYDDDEGTIRCTPSVRVVPDPRMRELLLPFERGVLRARKVEALAEEWLQVFCRLEQLDRLGRVERQFLLPFAASLTDPEFAAVLHALADVRRARTTELAGVLQQAGRSHESVGLFEFASAYDKAYQAFCRQMGLDPFAWAQSPFGGAERPGPERSGAERSGVGPGEGAI